MQALIHNILVSEPPGYRLLIGDRQQCDVDRFDGSEEKIGTAHFCQRIF